MSYDDQTTKGCCMIHLNQAHSPWVPQGVSEETLLLLQRWPAKSRSVTCIVYIVFDCKVFQNEISFETMVIRCGLYSITAWFLGDNVGILFARPPPESPRHARLDQQEAERKPQQGELS